MVVEEEWCVGELFRELFEPIASFLDITSVGCLLSVCKRLAHLSSCQRTWRVVAEQNFQLDGQELVRTTVLLNNVTGLVTNWL